MTIAPTLSFAARQQVTLSPRLQQAIRLLQMSADEFDREMRNALSSNPFLEDPTDAGAPVDAADRPEAAPPEADAFLLERSVTAAVSSAPRSGDLEQTDPSIWASARVDLREHLRGQLCAWPLHPRDRLAAEVVIEALDDDGYLRDELAGAAAALGLDQPLSAEELSAGVAIVRRLDPAGVAARDLIDCLSLQLEALEADLPGRELALRLLREGADLLARRDFAALRLRCGCTEQELRTAYHVIRRLDPRPGGRFSAPPPEYVTPDVIVVQRGQELIATINPALRPCARLNQRYVELLRRCRGSSRGALALQLQEARWLLRNVEQRFSTIQRVAEAILRRQHAFFVHGEVALKPMVLREVAEEVGLHESTVSRATGNKYMATARGLFEFKHFFSRQLPTRGGGACSAAAVRALMQEIIRSEDARAPLSDVTIADLLRHQGIKVARRTVAKYRTMMKVLPAELRRQA